MKRIPMRCGEADCYETKRRQSSRVWTAHTARDNVKPHIYPPWLSCFNFCVSSRWRCLRLLNRTPEVDHFRTSFRRLLGYHWGFTFQLVLDITSTSWMALQWDVVRRTFWDVPSTFFSPSPERHAWTYRKRRLYMSFVGLHDKWSHVRIAIWGLFIYCFPLKTDNIK